MKRKGTRIRKKKRKGQSEEGERGKKETDKFLILILIFKQIHQPVYIL